MNTLLAITLQAALLAAIVFTLTKLAARHIPPAWRAALWFLVIARLLIPIAPPSPLSLQNFFASAPAPVEQASILKGIPRVEVSGPFPTGHELVYTANITPAPSAPTPFPWQRLLITLWAAGAIASLTLLLTRALILRRRLAKSNTPPPPQTLDILQGCRDELSLRYPVRVSVSSEIAAPALTGIFPARLIVPANAETFSFAELRHVFLHELAHVKLGHLAFHWLTLLARCIHWFNPLVHFAANQLRHQCELAADAAALSRIEKTEYPAYGQTILEALRRATAAHSPLALAMAHHTRHLEQRLRSLSDSGSTRVQRFLGVTLLILLTACGMTGPKGGVATKTPDAQEPKKSVSVEDKSIKASPKVYVAPGSLRKRLETLTVDTRKLSYPADLGKTLKELGDQIRAGDPDGRGINFIVATGRIPKANAEVIEQFEINLPNPQGELRLLDVLDRIVRGAAPPRGADPNARLVYSIEDYAVVFTTGDIDRLLTRQYRLGVTTVIPDLQLGSPFPQRMLLDVFRTMREQSVFKNEDPAILSAVEKARADSFKWLTNFVLQIPSTNSVAAPNSTKAIFYNHRTGFLLVRSTLDELDKVEHALSLLSGPATINLASAEKAPDVTRHPKPNPPPTSPEETNLVQVVTRSIKLRGPFLTDLSGPANLDSLLRALDATRRLEKPYEHSDQTIVANVEKSRRAGFAAMTNAFARIQWSLDPQTQLLLIKGPESDLTAIERGLSLLDPPQMQQQVTFRAQILEMPVAVAEELLKGLSPSRAFAPKFQITNEVIVINDVGSKQVSDLTLSGSQNLLANVKDRVTSTNIVSPGQEYFVSPTLLKDLLEKAKKTEGVDQISAPMVTTVIGRQARISIEDYMTVMTPKNFPVGEKIPFGPIVDVIATEFDGEKLAYDTTLTLTEFLGYRPSENEKPLPSFRVRQLNAKTKVQPGLTHLFSASLPEVTIAGTTNITKVALFMITPTLVDGAGNIAFPEKHAK